MLPSYLSSLQYLFCEIQKDGGGGSGGIDHPCVQSSSKVQYIQLMHFTPYFTVDFGCNALLYLRSLIGYFCFVLYYTYKKNASGTAWWLEVKILLGARLVISVAVAKDLCCPPTESLVYLQHVKYHQRIFVIGSCCNSDFAVTSQGSETWVSSFLKPAQHQPSFLSSSQFLPLSCFSLSY